MREYNTIDTEELDLEENLPRIYEKIHNSCDEIAVDIVEKYWLDSSIWHLSDNDYDKEELIFYCQEQYDCPDFNEDNNGDFNDWLHDFWKRATRKEQEDLCFNYMGFDESDLAEVRCCAAEQYEIAIPQAIVEMVDIKKDDKPVFCNLTFKEREGELFFYADGQPFMISKKQWMSTKSKELAEMILKNMWQRLALQILLLEVS